MSKQNLNKKKYQTQKRSPNYSDIPPITHNSKLSTSIKPAHKNYMYWLVLTILFALIFCFSVLKNISTPLMWADESVTAVGAERVLNYGYPKVHNGKNTLYDLRHSNPELGIDKETDAYIGGANWGQYYFLAPFASIAHHYTDQYVKTLILRLPFAFAGLLGIFLLAWSSISLISDQRTRWILFSIFLFIEIASITLTLHIREVRYYSLQILFTSGTLSLFISHFLKNRLPYSIYIPLMVLELLCLFFSFAPAYFIIVLTLSFFITIFIFTTKNKNKYFSRTNFIFFIREMAPIFLSFTIILPFLIFFQTFHISEELAKFYQFTDEVYKSNLRTVWNYFVQYDGIFFYIVITLVFIGNIIRLLKNIELIKATQYVLLLNILFIVYYLAICRIPNYIFIRYFITIQPILAILVVLEAGILYKLYSKPIIKSVFGLFSVYTLLGAYGITLYYRNRSFISEHQYELFNTYRGPVDYVIDYIKQNYQNPEELVIATNYEETSYEYYLNCKTTIGFIKNNLDQDLKVKPDIIVYRRGWSWQQDQGIFEALLKKDNYLPVNLPVEDYFVNNIPELNENQQVIRHQFRTLITQNKDDQLIMYIKR